MQFHDDRLELQRLLADRNCSEFCNYVKTLCLRLLLHDAANRFAIVDGRMMLLARGRDVVEKFDAALPVISEAMGILRRQFQMLALFTAPAVTVRSVNCNPRELLELRLAPRLDNGLKTPPVLKLQAETCALTLKQLLILTGAFLLAGNDDENQGPVTLSADSVEWRIGPLAGSQLTDWREMLTDDPGCNLSGMELVCSRPAREDV